MPGFPLIFEFWGGATNTTPTPIVSTPSTRPSSGIARTSGALSQTTLDVADLCDKVMRRCGLKAADLVPETVKIITEGMYVFLSSMVNRDAGLWCIARELYGLNPGQAEYELYTGSVDVMGAVFRTPTRLTTIATSSAGGTVANLYDGDTETVFTQTSANGSLTFDLGASDTVFLLGILPAATGAHTLKFEVSDNNSNWRQVSRTVSPSFVDREWAWLQIDPAITGRYFRITESGGVAMSFREVYLANRYSDLQVTSMNQDDYTMLPRKQSLVAGGGRSYQYWLDRQIVPRIVLWPVPNTPYASLLVFSRRQIQDVGVMTNSLEVPQRWLMAIIDNVSYYCSLELPKMVDAQRRAELKVLAGESLKLAQADERDKGPIRIMPRIRGYTR